MSWKTKMKVVKETVKPVVTNFEYKSPIDKTKVLYWAYLPEEIKDAPSIP